MNEDVIRQIHEFVKQSSVFNVCENGRLMQKPFSFWAIGEIIDEIKINYYSLPDEIIKNFILSMSIREENEEIGRKAIYRIARTTAEELYFYLFERR